MCLCVRTCVCVCVCVWAWNCDNIAFAEAKCVCVCACACVCVCAWDSVKGQCRGLTGTVLCVSVYWNVYSLDVHVPCACGWQSSLYFADVYSYREATWHIVNDTRNLSWFFLFRSARVFMWPWLVIFSWEPRVWERVCVSVHMTVRACVLECVIQEAPLGLCYCQFPTLCFC